MAGLEERYKVEKKILKQIVKECEAEMQCNCDLDNWEPEKDTGHSFVCRIHNTAKARFLGDNAIITYR